MSTFSRNKRRKRFFLCLTDKKKKKRDGNPDKSWEFLFHFLNFIPVSVKGICSLGRRRRWSESQVTCKSPWRQHRTVTDKILKPKSLTPPWLLSTPHSSRSAQATDVYPAAWNPECFTPQKSQAPPTQVNRKQHLLPKVFVLLQEQFCSSVVHARPAFIRSKIQQNRTLMRIVNSRNFFCFIQSTDTGAMPSILSTFSLWGQSHTFAGADTTYSISFRTDPNRFSLSRIAKKFALVLWNSCV